MSNSTHLIVIKITRNIVKKKKKRFYSVVNFPWCRMYLSISLRAILNKSWRQHPTRHQLYGHLPPITKTIQVRRTRHAGHCWRSRDELIRDALLWTPTHGRAKAGRPARTYIQQLCEDTGCCPEDLPRAVNDREEWRERVRDIRCYQRDMLMMMINLSSLLNQTVHNYLFIALSLSLYIYI